MDIQRAMEILNITEEDLKNFVEQKYKKQAKKYHPDAGGNNSDMVLLNQAKEDMIEHMKNLGKDSNHQSLDDLINNFSDFWKDQRYKQEKNKNIIDKIYEEFNEKLTSFIRNNNLIYCNENKEKFYKYIGEELKKNGILNIEYHWSIHLDIYKYYYCLKRFYELYTDTSTYQLRNNKYYYRVWKQNGKLNQQYVGKELPESAMGFRKAKERKKHCANKAIESMIEIYGERH